ncbi:MAG: hypothetical protein IJ300_10510 [Clostridia bacterium]|nr:hypothetical protein [Clostridia bacterium]
MEYSKRFNQQWQRLIDEFTSYFVAYSNYGYDMKKLNSWYKDNTFRWKSIVSVEGELLASQDGSMKDKLLSEMEKFSFKKVNGLKKPNFLFYLVPSLILGIVGGIGASKFFDFSAILSAVVGIGITLAGIVLYAKNLNAHDIKQKKYLCDEYAEQLKKHGKVLCDVCKKYEM